MVEKNPCNEDALRVASELWIFAGLITLGQFSPGPDMVLLTRTALREGRGAGLRMASGITCGLMVHSTLAVAGVAVVFQRFPLMRQVLQWVAAIYLLWLATGLLRSALRKSDPFSDEMAAVEGNSHSPFVRGFLCNLLNPKAAMFLAAVCAPFLAGNHPQSWPVIIWAMVVGFGIFWWSIWVVVLQWNPIRAFNERAARWIDAMFGIALVALAIALMVD